MPEALNEQRPEWAYIVGGYPQRYRAVELRLQKLHINVNGHCESPGDFRVPKSTTLIIIIVDQCSHPMSQKARDYAKQFKIPLISGTYRNWCNMEAQLESRGVGYRSLELVAGGQEVLEINQTQPAVHLEDIISQAKRAELEDRVAPPKAATQEIVKKPTSKTQSKSLQMQEAIRAAIDVNKDHLEIYTNKQLAEDVSALLGYPVSVSGVALWRKKWKIKSTPKGYKSPKKAKEVDLITATSKMSEPEKVLSESDIQETIDSYQGQLDKFVVKFHINKLHIIYENGEWKTDWDRVTIVSKQKIYKK